MNDKNKEKTLKYINKKRNESNQHIIDEIEIGIILTEQFFKDQYIAMKIEKAKELAEIEFNLE